MFSRFRAFLSRHRRKLLIGGFVVGGAVILSRYVQRSLREWHERETKELIERANKQRHFESVERTCNQTAVTLIPSIRDVLGRLMNTNALVDELRKGNANNVTVWEDLKILAFAKITCLVYVTSMLLVALRVQLNLIGGYMYRANVGESEEKIGSEIQERYLNTCQYLLKDGASALDSLVREKVELLLRDKSLKKKMTVRDVEQLFWGIQCAISEDPRNPATTLANYVLPFDMENDPSSIYRQIVVETRDLLESSEMEALFICCVSRGFTYVMDTLSQFFVSSAENNSSVNINPQPGTSSTPDEFFAANLTDLNTVSIPLAKIIPILTGLISQTNVKTDVCCNWVQQLIFMENLKTMGANIYETFCAK